MGGRRYWGTEVKRHLTKDRDLGIWVQLWSTKGCGYHCSRIGPQPGKRRLRGEREMGNEAGNL